MPGVLAERGLTAVLRPAECDDTHPCEGLGRHATFRNFGMAFLTLFRVSTGDNWNGIMKVRGPRNVESRNHLGWESPLWPSMAPHRPRRPHPSVPHLRGAQHPQGTPRSCAAVPLHRCCLGEEIVPSAQPELPGTV